MLTTLLQGWVSGTESLTRSCNEGRQALTEVMVQPGWALYLCEQWARAPAQGTPQLPSEDGAEVFQGVLCLQNCAS